MFEEERNELRNKFFSAWQKHQNKLALEPLESEILTVILQHPEYFTILEHPEKFKEKDFAQENPFLHMSLHLALREQIKTNRPAGIYAIYQALCEKYMDALHAEHLMMECLENILWEAQRSGMAPDEKKYLENLKKL
jgi:hypothetical protein